MARAATMPVSVFTGPLNVIRAPTNISNTGVASFIDPPQLTTLSNGGYAVTYVDDINVVASVFDAQGQWSAPAQSSRPTHRQRQPQQAIVEQNSETNSRRRAG